VLGLGEGVAAGSGCVMVRFLLPVACTHIHKDTECVTCNKVDGLEALVVGFCGRWPGTVHICKVSALVEVKVLVHEQKNLQVHLTSDPLNEGPI
jgi:hypothetical protein